MPRIKPCEVQNKEECVELINEVARLELDRRKAELKLKKDVQALQDEQGPKIVAMQEAIDGKMARISRFLEGHSGVMFKPGTKSGETALADFGFRVGNPTLKCERRFTWEDVLKYLKTDEEMRKYVRTKEEVQKDTIKNDYAAGKLDDAKLKAFGMKVQQSESCWVEPKADSAT